MTKRQIVAAMKRHGIEGEVTGAGTNWEVEVADEKTKRKFQRLIGQCGGYKTGYGAWVIQSNPAPDDDLPYSCPASRWHY